MLSLNWSQALAWRMQQQLLNPVGAESVEGVVRRLGAVQARRNDTFGAKLLRADEDIARAHIDAIERGCAGLLTNAEAIDIYRLAVDQLRLLEPPSRSWKALTDERVAIHERNLAFLSAPDDFEDRISRNKEESEAWRVRVEGQLADR